MRVRIVGAHQSESRDVRFMSILIDDALAIDAGGLSAGLTLQEQDRIRALLVTHRHYDHIKDLPALAHHLWRKHSLQIYCTEITRKALQDYFFNDVIWPSMKHDMEGGYFALTWKDIVPGEPFDALDYRVTPIEVPHTTPTVGYLVERDGKSVFYTADTNPEGNPPWASVRPDLLLVETTMSSAYDDFAARFKHMTPLSLERELRAFHARQGYYPRTVCVHINPDYEEDVRKEVAALADKLNADVVAGKEDMVLEL